jgi:hypothetical protein
VLELAISLLAIPVLWAFANWRLGLLLCLATAILQDPLRKLTPDQPVLFVVFVGVVFGGAYLGALARGVPLSLHGMFRRGRQLVMPFSLLALLIVVQAFNSYVRFSNPMITLTGLLTYVVPLFSTAFAYQLACRRGEFCINQFLAWYIVCIAVALTTVCLEFAGYDWPMLGQVGKNLVIYDQYTGLAMYSFSGSFRASEIAAWHAMAAASFVLLINLQRATVMRMLAAIAAAVLLIGLGVLTGRRKIVVEFATFVSTYFILWIVFKKGAGKLAVIACISAALIGYGWLAAELREGVSEQKGAELSSYTVSSSYSAYIRRSQDVFQAVGSRFVELGIAPVMWAYGSYGFFGAGLGVGTQGTQHFGGGGEGAAEGGLGKITLELGVPGLFIMGWVAISLVRYLWRIMRVASRHSQRIAQISFGLFSFLVANAAGFSVATQAYGDLFILLILSWTLGFLLAIPVLVEREVRARAIVQGRTAIFRPNIAQRRGPLCLPQRSFHFARLLCLV